VTEACAHCGLPLRRRALAATVDGIAGRFCCIGCILAQQVTRSRGDDGHARAVLVRLGVATFFAMNVMMVSMPAYVPVVYGPEAGATDGPLFVVLRGLAMVLAAPVLILLGGPILAAAWQGLRRGVLATDALIVLGTGAAYGLSIANTIAGRPGVYFDTAAMLLLLVTLGRYLEARARADAGALVRRTLGAGPTRAWRVEGDRLVPVAPDALSVGDVVAVAPGDAFPTDGIVVDGEGGVDEAALTGEPLPVLRRRGDAVAGGATSTDGTFRVRVTALASASATARIAGLVDAALAARTHVERVADRTAAVLTPLVVAIALGAGAWWATTDGADRGIMVALAVLAVACPCGLGLATPLAMWTGVAAAARRGVVVRGAPVLERLADVRTVLFDKTGTLTAGEPRLVRVEPAALAPQLLALGAGLEAGLSHPIARGLVRAAAAAGIRPARVADVVVVPGHGVRGTSGGAAVAIGAPQWIAAAGAPPGDGLPVAIAREGKPIGILWFEEAVRDGAAEAIAALRELGLAVGLASGDTRAPAVRRLFAPDELALGLDPGAKVERVRDARAHGGTAMVGDGFNDAPALAAADVGVAVGEAADLTRTTADVVVRRDGVAVLPWMVTHARRVVRTARRGVAWAFVYNAVAVALAATGRLTPVVATLAMLASSLAVVANARRLADPLRPASSTDALAPELATAA
jgi:Cu2+-exporting ATPase